MTTLFRSRGHNSHYSRVFAVLCALTVIGSSFTAAASEGPDAEPSAQADQPPATGFGGDDNDRLFGDAGKDILKGNDGVDIADGGLHKDWCEAETRTRCEVAL